MVVTDRFHCRLVSERQQTITRTIAELALWCYNIFQKGTPFLSCMVDSRNTVSCLVLTYVAQNKPLTYMLLTVINTRCNWFVSGKKPLLGPILVVRVTNPDVKMRVEELPLAILDLWRHLFRHLGFPVTLFQTVIWSVIMWLKFQGGDRKLRRKSKMEAKGDFPNLHSHIQTGRTGPVFYICLRTVVGRKLSDRS